MKSLTSQPAQPVPSRAASALSFEGIHLVSMAFYDKIYFLLVVVEHLPEAYWLLRVRDEQC